MAALTTIATATGIAASAVGSGMSFAEANKQKKAQRSAEEAASKAIEAARKKLEVNVYDAIGIQKTPYELEREAMLSAGAQATEAARESERGVAATAGRVYAGQQAGQADVQTRMGQEMLGLEKLSAQEESRLRDLGVSMDMMEAQGAQMAAAQAEEQATQATAQGIEGAISTVQQGVEAIPLFRESAAAKKFKGLMKSAEKAGMSSEDFQARVQQVTGKTYKSPMEMKSDLTSMEPDMLDLLEQRVFNPEKTAAMPDVSGKLTPPSAPGNIMRRIPTPPQYNVDVFSPIPDDFNLIQLPGFYTNKRK
jgi:hypothetical protein